MGLDTRHSYSNTASTATLAGAVTSGATSWTLNTFTGYPNPVPNPYVACIGRNTAKEELVLVTGVTGSTVVATRGYDSTAAQAHDPGETFEHVAAKYDYDNANRHTSAASGEHGVTGALVGTTDAQTVTGKTLSADLLLATATDPAVKAQAAGSGTAALFLGLDSAGSATLFRVARDGAGLLTVNAVGSVPLTVQRFAGQTAKLLQLLTEGSVELLGVDKEGKLLHTAASDTATPNIKVKDNGTAGPALQVVNGSDAEQVSIGRLGDILTPQLRAKGFFGGSDFILCPADGSKFKVDSAGNVSGNNLPQVRAADKGKKIQFGTFTSTFSAESSKTGTLTFTDAFSAAPDMVQATVGIGANLDVLVNWTNAPTSTGVGWRLFQRALSNISGTATVHWMAIGAA